MSWQFDAATFFRLEQICGMIDLKSILSHVILPPYCMQLSRHNVSPRKHFLQITAKETNHMGWHVLYDRIE